MCSQFFKYFLKKIYISETSASATKIIVLIKFYIKLYDIFYYTYIIITSDYIRIALFTKSYIGNPTP